MELKTELGKKLFALRVRAIKEGIKLLSEDEVLEEVARRRERIMLSFDIVSENKEATDGTAT